MPIYFFYHYCSHSSDKKRIITKKSSPNSLTNHSSAISVLMRSWPTRY